MQYHRRIRDLGTWAVIIGVVAEIVIDEFWEIEKPPLLRGIKATTLLKARADRFKRWAMIFAGVVMVGGGIGVEMWQGGKADDIADQIRTNLQRRIVFLMPRYRLLAEASQRLIPKLRIFRGQRVVIRTNERQSKLEGWSELVFFQLGIAELLDAANWLNPSGSRIMMPDPHNPASKSCEDCFTESSTTFVTGVEVEVDRAASKTTRSAASAVDAALKSLYSVGGEWPASQPPNVLSQRPSWLPNADVIVVTVGRQP